MFTVPAIFIVVFSVAIGGQHTKYTYTYRAVPYDEIEKSECILVVFHIHWNVLILKKIQLNLLQRYGIFTAEPTRM